MLHVVKYYLLMKPFFFQSSEIMHISISHEYISDFSCFKILTNVKFIAFKEKNNASDENDLRYKWLCFSVKLS